MDSGVRRFRDWPSTLNVLGGAFWSLINHTYTAKVLFHQSPTRHSDYTVTWQWWCSHCCYVLAAQGLCRRQLSTVTTKNTPLLSSLCVVTVPTRWLMKWSLFCFVPKLFQRDLNVIGTPFNDRFYITALQFMSSNFRRPILIEFLCKSWTWWILTEKKWSKEVGPTSFFSLDQAFCVTLKSVFHKVNTDLWIIIDVIALDYCF